MTNSRVMGWVIKTWHAEGLAALVSEHSRHAARHVMQTAERDARRIRRTVERERLRTQGDLQQLEALGGELLLGVRERRDATRWSGGPGPDGPPAPELRVRDLRSRPARGRSRLRASPLAELFRPTV